MPAAWYGDQQGASEQVPVVCEGGMYGKDGGGRRVCRHLISEAQMGLVPMHANTLSLQTPDKG